MLPSPIPFIAMAIGTSCVAATLLDLILIQSRAVPDVCQKRELYNAFSGAPGTVNGTACTQDVIDTASCWSLRHGAVPLIELDES